MFEPTHGGAAVHDGAAHVPGGGAVAACQGVVPRKALDQVVLRRVATGGGNSKQMSAQPCLHWAPLSTAPCHHSSADVQVQSQDSAGHGSQFPLGLTVSACPHCTQSTQTHVQAAPHLALEQHIQAKDSPWLQHHRRAAATSETPERLSVATRVMPSPGA